MKRDEDLGEIEAGQGLLQGKSIDRLRPACEKRKDGIGDFRAHFRGELFARRAPHARQAAERREQRPPPPRADARHVVELRVQITHRPGAPMERHREPVRLVADAL